MSDTININSYRDKSLKNQLKNFYRSIDSEKFSNLQTLEEKVKYVHSMHGHFITILRKSKQLTVGELSQLIHVTEQRLQDYENGKDKLTDIEFRRIFRKLNESDLFYIFIEKFEEALKPGLEKNRRKIARPLLQQYGIRFYDPGKYKEKINTENKVLNFKLKK